MMDGKVLAESSLWIVPGTRDARVRVFATLAGAVKAEHTSGEAWILSFAPGMTPNADELARRLNAERAVRVVGARPPKMVTPTVHVDLTGVEGYEMVYIQGEGDNK